MGQDSSIPSESHGNLDENLRATDLTDALLADADNCPQPVVALASCLAVAVAEPLALDLATASGLTDRARVLARIRTMLDAEVGRTILAAQKCDALPHAPVTQLQRDGAWSTSSASAVVTAARFCDRHRELSHLWRRGALNAEVIAALARGLRGVTHQVELDVVHAVLPSLPKLSVRGVKVLICRVLDLLHPDDRAAAEQTEWERRSLVYSTHGSMTMIAADLPGIEGAAVTAALDSLADSLRVEGDGTTVAQRRADALITLVNRAAADGSLPAARGGLPVAATITVGVSEADRVASGRSPVVSSELSEPPIDPAALPAISGGATIGDAALRFALCGGTLTGVLVDDSDRQGRPVLEALTHTRMQPLAVGRSTRLATAAQRTALALRDGGCLLCGRAPAECQTHHVTPWSEGGNTDLNNLVLLCWSHHRQVDLNRWVIQRNPEADADGPPWRVTPVPRHQWRRRMSRAHAA